MKHPKRSFLLIISALLPILFLSACTESDWYLAELAFESWARGNGLYENGKYKPEGVVVKAVEDTLGEITNREENVQLDGLEVIRDIQKAEDLAHAAFVHKDTDEMQEAVKMRPEDWRLQEQNAALWLYNSNSSAANTAQTTADDLLQNSIRGGNCVALRKQQLEYRERSIQKSLSECLTKEDCANAALDEALFNTQEELQGIYATGHAAFCDQ